MYPKTQGVTEFDKFYVPFGGELDKENRWVKLHTIIPWEQLEGEYSGLFKKKGAPAKIFQIALGALIIQNRCGFTDRELVEQIRENLYLQFFIGKMEYSNTVPFDASTMVYFRKRIKPETLQKINDLICGIQKENDENKDDDSKNGPAGNSEEKKEITDENEGTLILDATCAPADIKYPTDLNLLNEAREKLDEIIDILHQPMKGTVKRPRTYRNKARREYLLVAKNKKKSAKELRKAIGKQLRFVKRNLEFVESMVQSKELMLLTKREYKNLLVINELYRQQKEMYDAGSHSIEGRIVSISQPHVRPIVRGKAGANVEFGAKLSISVVNGFSYPEKISWENYNEGCFVIEQVENYRTRFGHYPEVVNADKIHRTRDNIKFCKGKGIRMCGPKLGRPPVMDTEEASRQKKLEREDTGIRNEVEGSFGVVKRRYSLGLIMAKLSSTSETVITIQFLVMNLEKRLRSLLRQIILTVFKRIFACMIIESVMVS